MMAHLITLKDWSREQIEEVLNLAAEMKKAPEKFQDVMRGKMLVMIFEKPSLLQCTGEGFLPEAHCHE